MYCAKCKERMELDELLKDTDGYNWPYDVQVCKKCRPKDKMTVEELELFLDRVI